MNDFPENVLAAIEQAVTENRESVDDAVARATSLVANLPNANDLSQKIFETAIRDLVHRARHKINKMIRQRRGEYYPNQKVNAASPEVVKAAASYFNYNLGGTTLGRLRGCELARLAQYEDAQVKGHKFNSILLKKLAGVVPEQATVQEALGGNEESLAELFRQSRQEVYNDAPETAG